MEETGEKHMENTRDTIDVVAPRKLYTAVASSRLNSGSRGGDHLTQHVEPLSTFALQQSSPLMDDSRSPAPPIALLSRRRRQDPAVMRLHAVLASSTSGGSLCDVVHQQQQQYAPSPKTTNPALSPKNTLSLGYDDDAVSSSFSTPGGGSSPFLFRAVKNHLASTNSFQPSSLSGDTEDAVVVVFSEVVATDDHLILNLEHPPQHRSGSAAGVLQKDCQTTDEDSMAATQRGPPYVVDRHLTPRQVTDNDDATSSGQSFSSGCGVLGATAAVVDGCGKDDAVGEVGTLFHHVRSDNGDDDEDNDDGDEVIGVTAEGKFIYRRDAANEVERQRRGCHQGLHEWYDVAGEGSCTHDAVVSAEMQKPAVDTLFCTPERSIFSTTLSSKVHLPLPPPPPPPPPPQCVQFYGSLMDTGLTPSPIPPSPSVLFSEACDTLPRQAVRCRSSMETPVWTTHDVEWCDLLVRHCVRENAGDSEYHDLVGAVDDWCDAQQRYPTEALESRLREEQHDKPPFILRW